MCYWYKYANYLSLHIRNGDNFVNKSLMIFPKKTLKFIKWQKKKKKNRFSLVLVFKVDQKKNDIFILFKQYAGNSIKTFQSLF